MTDEEIFGIKEVFSYLELAAKMLYRLAFDVELVVSKVGGSYRFRKYEIDVWG